MADAHAKPHHAYHLVNPSPWPLIGASFAFLTAVGLIMSMKGLSIGGLKLGVPCFGIGVARPFLHLGVVVDRCRPRGGNRRPLPGRSDQPSLRHDPVHRLRGDVLRRLVLGVLRRVTVHRGADSGGARRLHRRRLAAQGHRGARSVESAAAQHADPAHLRRDGHLGASRVAAQRPSGFEDRIDADHCSRPLLHQHSGAGNIIMRRSPFRIRSTAPPFSWRRASTARTSSSARSS